MYGYIVSKFTPQIVMEYCEMGDILKYVSSKEITDEVSDCRWNDFSARVAKKWAERQNRKKNF